MAGVGEEEQEGEEGEEVRGEWGHFRSKWRVLGDEDCVWDGYAGWWHVCWSWLVVTGFLKV